VVNQGGEPHAFTEVSQFGGGFIEPLDHGEATVPECADGFHNVAVARTRILQGSRLDVTRLSKGKASVRVLHPSLDAVRSRREMSVLKSNEASANEAPPAGSS
jgi:hypothetical protein